MWTENGVIIMCLLFSLSLLFAFFSFLFFFCATELGWLNLFNTEMFPKRYWWGPRFHEVWKGADRDSCGVTIWQWPAAVRPDDSV